MQEEKRMTEDEIVTQWHQQVNGYEFEQIPGNSEGQGSLVCCSPWGRRVGHNSATEQQQFSASLQLKKVIRINEMFLFIEVSYKSTNVSKEEAATTKAVPLK